MNYEKIARPLNELLLDIQLTELLRKKQKGVRQIENGVIRRKLFFNGITQKLTNPLVHAIAYFSKPPILNIDASIDGFWAVLYQLQNGMSFVTQAEGCDHLKSSIWLIY